ncbi:MAG: rRNA pseudouridine synthase [Candidatus Pacebacteria bacterium]|jgi:23S rRNA pseudouridine2605 synthase|nr:rRNA pseudouridine synthase [Candidatus Paceibacterota bacterium]
MTTIKISKYLSQAGIASRRKAETLVQQGLISVNGKVVTNVAVRIDPAGDKIEFSGKPVAVGKHVYYLLNKPVGYTCTVSDAHAEKLITALTPRVPKVWPVGRLDKYTSGLILLTNDGDLTQRLTHPRYRVEKEYRVRTNYPLSNSDIGRIAGGVRLDDGYVKPDEFEKTGPDTYRIIIHSGAKHVVRRLIEHVGKSVVQLERIRIGGLCLENLAPGKWRPLDANEIKKLSQPGARN